MISAEQVRELRELTGAGMMECKKALTDANGDFEKAIVLLRERGLKEVDNQRFVIHIIPKNIIEDAENK